MKFVFRPVLSLATALALAILCSLGVWQLQRLAWKNDLVARVEARLRAEPLPFEAALARAGAGEDMEYQPVLLAGAFAHDLEARVFGTLDGAPGTYVFTPFRPADKSDGESYVYVNRGFVPQRGEATEKADPAGPVVVRGLFRCAEAPVGLPRAFRPKDQPKDNLYFVRDPRILAKAHGVAASACYIDGNGAESAGPLPKGGTHVEFQNRHLEYALTWFGLAAALLAVFLAFSRKP